MFYLIKLIPNIFVYFKYILGIETVESNYTIGGILMKNIKKKIITFVLSIATLITALPMSSSVAFAAENYNGGWALVRNSNGQEVFNESSLSTHKGTVYAGEGVTVLNVSGNSAEIQYSTSGAPKTGFVPVSSLDTSFLASTCVAKVTTSSNVYYGNSTSYSSCGSVSSGELVVILAKNGSWVYVEYNTSGGRKRGYMLYSNLSCYNRPSYFPDIYTYNNAGLGTHRYNEGSKLLSGPSSQYRTVTTLKQTVNLTYYYSYTNPAFPSGSIEYEYVEYVDTDGIRKSGFIECDYY